MISTDARLAADGSAGTSDPLKIACAASPKRVSGLWLAFLSFTGSTFECRPAREEGGKILLGSAALAKRNSGQRQKPDAFNRRDLNPYVAIIPPIEAPSRSFLGFFRPFRFRMTPRKERAIAPTNRVVCVRPFGTNRTVLFVAPPQHGRSAHAPWQRAARVTICGAGSSTDCGDVMGRLEREAATGASNVGFGSYCARQPSVRKITEQQ